MPSMSPRWALFGFGSEWSLVQRMIFSSAAWVQPCAIASEPEEQWAHFLALNPALTP